MTKVGKLELNTRAQSDFNAGLDFSKVLQSSSVEDEEKKEQESIY